jgi:2-dehydro-3-deoxyphosphogluconate aldolase / (4S)-4-hydroxy-2-oxoglutarate aldolase
VKDKFQSAGVIPVLIFEKDEYAVPTARALIAGGLDVLEVTLRTEAAWAALEAILTECPEATVGVGTVLDHEQMRRAKDLGASFAVSPGFHPFLVSTAQELDLFYMPGVATPSEVMQASSMGLSSLKFFPAEAAGGTAMLKSFISPFGAIDFCPTGGISTQNADEYRALKNVFCIGGSWVATGDDMAKGDWDAITQKAKQVN